VQIPGTVRRAAVDLALGANLWASGITLGVVVVTPLAVVSSVVSLWTGNIQAALVATLAVSLVANFILLCVLVLIVRRAAKLSMKTGAITDAIDPDRKPAVSWLPDQEGYVPLTTSTLETAYEESLAAAHEIGADAQLALVKVSLDETRVELYGFSHAEGKAMDVWWTPGTPPVVHELRRAATPLYQMTGAASFPWHEDQTWYELLKRSWEKERPFAGTVTLSIEAYTKGTQPRSRWQARYVKDDYGVRARPVYYYFDGGELSRSVRDF
jgi:hypothetical protein